MCQQSCVKTPCQFIFSDRYFSQIVRALANISPIQMQNKSHKAGISFTCIVQRSQQGHTICEQVYLSESELRFVNQEAKMGLRGCAGLRE